MPSLVSRFSCSAGVTLKATLIGDSLSSGEHESLIAGQIGWHDDYEYSWGQFMARACGSKVYNFSCGPWKSCMPS